MTRQNKSARSGYLLLANTDFIFISSLLIAGLPEALVAARQEYRD